MIAEHLKHKLDSIGSYLGGYNEMTKIYTEDELAYISLYPSDIFTITTWDTSEIVDLKTVGYIPYTEYYIYDKYNNLIVRNKGEGILGQTDIEEEIIIESENGAYFFIMFKQIKRWKQVLLIIASKAPLIAERNYFNKLKQSSPRYVLTNERKNQVILGTSNLIITEPAKIVVYSINANLTSNINTDFIKTYSKEPLVYYSYNNEFQDIILTPNENTWYHFLLLDNNDNLIANLDAINMAGTGESNWVQSNSHLYYLELNNRIPINLAKLVTTNIYNRQLGVNLYGELSISNISSYTSALIQTTCSGSLINSDQLINEHQLSSGSCVISLVDNTTYICTGQLRNGDQLANTVQLLSGECTTV